MSETNVNYPKSVIDIYNVLKSEAVHFILVEVGGANKQAEAKLRKAIKDCKVETTSFDDTCIDLLSFDWCSIEMDRNWWWQIQALPFLGWFAQSYRVFDPEERRQLASYCLNALEQWLKQETHAENSPLRWHDHATAYRLNNLVNWLAVVSSDDELVEYVRLQESVINLAEIINTHVIWLNQEENYSLHTNHGFDQAISVYSLGLYVKEAYWGEEIRTARTRLSGELRFAFTDEGVHKENSPGYHMFMMNRLKKLSRLELVGDQLVGFEARKIQKGAECFMDAVTLPNGNLPMIGDTRGGHKGKFKDIHGDLEIYDFTKSGYVIVKGLDYKNKKFCLIFKNAHDSHYHRHDDDLSIFLYYDGQVLLGDGGLGGHDEKDPRRILLRGAKSHNVPFPDGVSALRLPGERLKKNSIIYSNNLIYAKSYCYGFEILRKVDISKISEGCLIVEDIFDEIQQPCLVNFFTEGEPNIIKNSILINFENNYYCNLSVPMELDAEPYVLKDSLISFNYNEYSQAFSFGWKRLVKKISVKINFGRELYKDH